MIIRKSIISLAVIMALSACGGSSSNNEKISGDTSGIDDGTGSISGALTVTGDDTFIPVTSAAEDFGTFSIDETGVWEYIAEASNPNVLELGEGETATEEVTVTTADGETQIITVTVVGVDDAPVIGTGDGVDTATLASDSSDTVTGTLTIADPDKNQSVFIPQTDTAGTYGTFSITTEGVWTYTLAPTASIAAVSTAATSNDDTFIVTSADGTEHDVVITVTASDNATPTLSECTGTSSLTIISATDDGTFDKTSAPAGTIDGLTDTDAASRWSSDASDADKAITFDLGELSKVKQLELLWLKANERTTYYNIETSADNTDGSWISVLTDGESTLAADSSYSFETVALTESEAQYVRLTSSGNSASGWVSLIEAKVAGCQVGDTGVDPVPAIISGDVTGAVTEDATTDASGTLTVVDPDTGEDAFIAKTDTATTYGTFSVDTLGAWTYTLTDDLSSVNDGDTTTDAFTVATVDGTTETITITITGADEVSSNVPANKVASITDTDDDDSGELRYNLDSALTKGKLTVSVLPDADKTAYIGLYTPDSTSTSDALIDLKINASGSFEVRDQDDIDDIEQTFTPGEWVDIEISWDSSSDTEYSQITLTIDGGTPIGPFTSATSLSHDDTDIEDENDVVTQVVDPLTVDNLGTIIFKLGDNSSIVTGSYLVDDIKIYSDTAGTVEEFSDDFESYDVGADLADDPYNDSSTYEAVVAEYIENDGSSTDITQAAAITDTATDDSGELRYYFDNGQSEGKLNVSLLYAVGETETAYITLFDADSNNDGAILDLQFDDGKIKLRGEDAPGTFTPGEWQNVEMTWNTDNDDGETKYTIMVNGTDYGSYTSHNTTIGAEVTSLTIKLASDSKVATTTLYVDDLTIYDDESGSNDALLNDDFEGYSVDDELSGASNYDNDKTFSAVVAEIDVINDSPAAGSDDGDGGTTPIDDGGTVCEDCITPLGGDATDADTFASQNDGTVTILGTTYTIEGDDLSDTLALAQGGDEIVLTDADGISLKNISFDDMVLIRAADGVDITLDSASITNSNNVAIQGFTFKSDDSTYLKIANSTNIKVLRNTFDHEDVADGQSAIILTQASQYIEVAFNTFKNKNIASNADATDLYSGSYIKTQLDEKDDDSSVLYMTKNMHVHHNHFDNIASYVEADGSVAGDSDREAIVMGISDSQDIVTQNVIEYNLFENCDGENEIITVKTSSNIFRYNTFKNSMGSLSFRLGSNNVANNNYFYGEGDSTLVTDDNYQTGGIRVYGEGHEIYDNYMKDLTGTTWRLPLLIDNGDDSDSSGGDNHETPTNVEVTDNIIVNSKGGVHVGRSSNTLYNNAPNNNTITDNIVVGSEGILFENDADDSTNVWSGNQVFATGTATAVGGATLETAEVEILAAEPTLTEPTALTTADVGATAL